MTTDRQDRSAKGSEWKTLVETGADASTIGDLTLEMLMDRIGKPARPEGER